jgi:hypothetical protein
VPGSPGLPPDDQLCGPPNPTGATEAPPEALTVGQRMSLIWRLCYMWRAVEHLNGGNPDFYPDRFVLIRQAYVLGYPARPDSPEVDGPADGVTEVTIARIQAFSAGYVQRVEIELQIQYDGDYIDFRGAQVVEQLPPDFKPPPPATFAAGLDDAAHRGLLPDE